MPKAPNTKHTQMKSIPEIKGYYIGYMQVLWDSRYYETNQNKTYAPLEVKGAQGRNIGGIVKGKLYL